MSKIRILLVEDEPMLVMLLTESLHQAGFEVFSAPSLDNAQRLFEQYKEEIGLVITDIRLAESSGFTLAQQIRQQAADCPILFMSGDQGDRDEAEKFTAPSAYLNKPFDLMDFQSSALAVAGISFSSGSAE